MKFIISGKNIDVTPGLKAAVEDKIGKLEKYFTPETEVHATLSVEKERQKIEVTIPVKGSIIRSEQVSNDMYVSVDLAAEVIERQLKKYKNKIVIRGKKAGKAMIQAKEGKRTHKIKVIVKHKQTIAPTTKQIPAIETQTKVQDTTSEAAIEKYATVTFDCGWLAHRVLWWTFSKRNRYMHRRCNLICLVNTFGRCC